jgi:hypothetical protein
LRIPVYIKTGPKIHLQGDSAYIKDKTGVITWQYHGKNHKGIGIVACARSATMYMSKLLRELGYDVGHEEWGQDGSVGYHLMVIKPENCFHQVRHPLKQISSMLVHQSWGFMLDVIDLEDLKLRGCMDYWLRWNQMCEEFCVWRYQIENLPTIWYEFLSRIGHEKCDMPDIPTNINTSKKEKYLERTRYKELTWDDLFSEDRQLAQDIYNKSLEYGYAPERIKQTIQTTQVA